MKSSVGISRFLMSVISTKVLFLSRFIEYILFDGNLICSEEGS